jgi:light-regulated signal transduction histidine kinase (bacteriophytochrome)
MSHAMLRSVSPIHLQYLANMHVASTLTISLLVDDRLWGLIACHHRTPTALPIEMQRACHALAINLGFMVGWKEQQRRAATIARAHQAQGVIIDAFNRYHEPLPDVIRHSAAELLRITGSTGGALWHGATVWPFGQWPGGARGESVMRHTRQAFEHSAEDLVYTERQALQPELSDDELRSVCGVMAVKLGGAADSGIVWIRPEYWREVAWGGDPDKPIEVALDASGQPKLAPRASFARWKTLVKGRSRPWSDLDRAAARSLSTLGHVLTGRAALAEVSLNDRRLRSLVALQSDAYWQVGANGRLAALSKPLFAGQGSVQGMTPAELLAAYCDGATIAALELALAGNKPFRALRVRGHNAANRRDFEFLVSGEPMREHSGLAAGWHGTITDVTREVALQTSLQRREVFLDRTGLVGGLGGWQVDLTTRAVEWTEQCYRIHELELGHAVTIDSAMDFYAAEAQPLIRRAVADAIARGLGWDLELPLVTATGRAIWVRVVAEVELADGQPARIVGALQDITERRAMQAELQHSEKLLRDVLDAVVDEAFVLYDADDRLVLCNEQFRALFGSGRDLIVRTSAERQHYEASAGGYDDFIAERTATHLAGTTDLIEQGADGRSLRVIGRKLPDGQRVEFRFDVTRLVRAIQSAEEASRAKGEFIATISHELRTPLQSIIGFSELGEHFAAAQPQFAEMFGDIHAGGRRMLELVNDLLDLSKIYSTLDSLVLCRRDLAALVREVVTELRPLASKRALRIQIPELLPPLLADVDPPRFQQVIRNVLANALRFAPDGSRIEIGFVDHGGAGTEIGVRDHGPGIPPAELDSIFAAFAQSTRTRDGSGGTGLGLTICRKIMSGHGGSIDAVNAAGGGALMRIRLPASVPGRDPGSARQPPQGAPPTPQRANQSAQFCAAPQEITR